MGQGRVYTAGSLLLSREQLVGLDRVGSILLGLYCYPGSSWLVGQGWVYTAVQVAAGWWDRAGSIPLFR